MTLLVDGARALAGLLSRLDPRSLVVEPPPPPPDPTPLAVACPRCGAAPGQPCNRRTLGRHPYHLARVEARRG